MQVLNPEVASRFLDTVEGERQRSAVLAIHLAWLDHSSPLGRSERIEPEMSLDLSILYQAAAATVQQWPETLSLADLPPGSRVMNRQIAVERLSSLPEGEVRLLATAFARHVIRLSVTAENEQNLDYHVRLFLKCTSDPRVIENIRSGAISEQSDRLSDPDLW